MPVGSIDAFAASLRRLLTECSRRQGRRITLDMLAEAIGVDVGTVGRWGRGKHRPQRRHIDALCEFLGVAPAELGCDVADLPPRPATTSARRGGRLQADLRAVEAAIVACRHLDGAGQTRDARAVVLDHAARLHRLSRNAHSEILQKRIALDAAQLYQLAGWLSFDTSDYQSSRRYNQRARRAVQEASSPSFHAWILSGNVSYIEAHLGKIGDALDSAYAAQMHAMRSNNQRSVAYALTISALVHASARDQSASRSALKEAEAAYARARREDDPEWIAWFDDSEMLGHRGACMLLLDDPHHAIEALRDGIAVRGDDFVRSRALDLLDLAFAHAHPRLKEFDVACLYASDALAIAHNMSSVRTVRRLQEFAHAMTRWMKVPAVHEFNEHFQAFLLSRA